MNELASTENQVKDLGLHDKLGKQKFHFYMEKVVEPVTKAARGTAMASQSKQEKAMLARHEIEDTTKSIEDIMKNFSQYDSPLLPDLSDLFDSKNTTQIRLRLNTTSPKEMFRGNNVTVEIRRWTLIFTDSNIKFVFESDILVIIFKYKFNRDPYTSWDGKLFLDFLVEMRFDVRRF